MMNQFGFDRVLLGDANKLLKTIPSSSVNLIITSPPYSNRRKHSYGGVSPEEYVDWFLPVSHELFRILKPDGSFIINIKEGANGEKETYVIELILELRKQGWLWIEEYMWHKTTSLPGKWPNRFRDAWERCLHFTKSHKFKMYQDNVKVKIGDWAEKRMKKLSKSDRVRKNSNTGSGLGVRVANWSDRRYVYPDNVLEFSPVANNAEHSAAFPKELPRWFIRLFTKKGDVVLDPFIGSGTSAVASVELGRRFIGIELQKAYHRLAENNIKKAQNEQKKSI